MKEAVSRGEEFCAESSLVWWWNKKNWLGRRLSGNLMWIWKAGAFGENADWGCCVLSHWKRSTCVILVILLEDLRTTCWLDPHFRLSRSFGQPVHFTESSGVQGCLYSHLCEGPRSGRTHYPATVKITTLTSISCGNLPRQRKMTCAVFVMRNEGPSVPRLHVRSYGGIWWLSQLCHLRLNPFRLRPVSQIPEPINFDHSSAFLRVCNSFIHRSSLTRRTSVIHLPPVRYISESLPDRRVSQRVDWLCKNSLSPECGRFLAPGLIAGMRLWSDSAYSRHRVRSAVPLIHKPGGVRLSTSTSLDESPSCKTSCRHPAGLQEGRPGAERTMLGTISCWPRRGNAISKTRCDLL